MGARGLPHTGFDRPDPGFGPPSPGGSRFWQDIGGWDGGTILGGDKRVGSLTLDPERPTPPRFVSVHPRGPTHKVVSRRHPRTPNGSGTTGDRRLTETVSVGASDSGYRTPGPLSVTHTLSGHGVGRQGPCGWG